MNIEMVNDGPVTLILESQKDPRALKKQEALERRQQKGQPSAEAEETKEKKPQKEAKEKQPKESKKQETSSKQDETKPEQPQTKEEAGSKDLNALREENKKLQYRMEHLLRAIEQHPANKKV